MIPPLRSDVPAACADDQTAIAHLDADGVPPAVFLSAARVRQVVLLAQFVGDAGGRGVQTLESADDFRTPTRIVGDLTQGGRVDAFTARVPSAAENSPGRLRQCGPPAAREGERKRNRARDGGRRRRLASGTIATGRVDAEGVHHHLALANQLAQFTDADVAV